MTEKDLRPVLEMVPFEPFTISLTDRSTYDIDRPERVSFSPHGDALRLHTADGSVRVVISTRHIVSVTWAARPVVRGPA